MTVIIYSCGDKGINDSSKRNENYIWFVDKTTGNGTWVPLGDHTTIDNGTYTAFYYDGKIREKGKIVEREFFDSVFYYDINERLIKYSIIKTDTTVNYYINEGPYKAYSPTGELILDGVVKNHCLEGENWHGAFGHYIKVIDAVIPVTHNFHKFITEFKAIIVESEATSDSSVSREKLKK